MNFITQNKHANRSLITAKNQHPRISKSIFAQVDNLTAPIIGSYLGKNYFFKKSPHELSLLHRYLRFLNLSKSQDTDAPSNKEAQLYFHSYFPKSKHTLHNAVATLGGNRIYGINSKDLLGWLLIKYWHELYKCFGIDHTHLITKYGQIGHFLVYQTGFNYHSVSDHDLRSSLNHDLLGGSMSDIHYHAFHCFLKWSNRILKNYSIESLRKTGVRL